MQELNNLVEQLKTFQSTWKQVSPGHHTGEESLDILAIVAGTKPTALCTETYSLDDRMRCKTFHQYLEDNGIFRYSMDELYEDHKGHAFFYTSPEQLEELKRVVEIQNTGNIQEYYERLGRLLGYSEDAIDEFVQRVVYGKVREGYWEHYAFMFVGLSGTSAKEWAEQYKEILKIREQNAQNVNKII